MSDARSLDLVVCPECRALVHRESFALHAEWHRVLAGCLRTLALSGPQTAQER